LRDVGNLSDQAALHLEERKPLPLASPGSSSTRVLSISVSGAKVEGRAINDPVIDPSQAPAPTYAAGAGVLISGPCAKPLQIDSGFAARVTSSVLRPEAV
jgi:hypothetical protein